MEGARAAGIDTYGWHTATAVGDVNADGLPDLFVAGYTDLNALSPEAAGSGFPLTHAGVRDRLYLNQGLDANGRSRFREVAQEVGIEADRVEHGLGAVFTDVEGDGDVDLYVANDLDPNRLYLNVPDPAGLGSASRSRVEPPASPTETRAWASPRPTRARTGARISSSRTPTASCTGSSGAAGQVPRSQMPGRTSPRRSTQPSPAGALPGRTLDLDGHLDLAFANGAIPITKLDMDAEPIKVIGRVDGEVADVSAGVGLGDGPLVNGRGLAAADYDNDGDLDLAVASIAGELVLPAQLRRRGPPAPGAARLLLAGDEGHGDPPGRAQARQRGSGGGQLPVLRGSAPPLRTGRDEGASAGRALSGRRCEPPSGRCSRPSRRSSKANVTVSE